MLPVGFRRDGAEEDLVRGAKLVLTLVTAEGQRVHADRGRVRAVRSDANLQVG